MKIEPDLDKNGLVAALEDEYGITAQALRFHPTDFFGYNYVLECLDGALYFLKLRTESGRQPYVAGSPEFHLALTDQLFKRGILPNIPHPYKTRNGGLQVRFGEYWLALYNFIPGQTVGFGNITGEVKARLARLVGVLHHNLPALELTNPLVERYQVAFEGDLIAMLTGLETLNSDAREAQQLLRDTLLPHRREILGYLRRLKALQREVIAINKTRVVCHTDLHGGNLMLDESGKLYIMDWDNAMVAPPEHDLFFFAGEEDFLEVFLPNYETEFGPAELDMQVLGFYSYRRGLEDLSEFVVRILDGNGDERRDLDDLHWIAENGVGLAQVEDKLDKIYRKLKSRQNYR